MHRMMCGNIYSHLYSLRILDWQESLVCKQHYTVTHQAEQQIVLEMYKDVEALYLRGYIIAQLSYMILGLREKGTYLPHTFNRLSNEMYSEQKVAKAPVH